MRITEILILRQVSNDDIFSISWHYPRACRARTKLELALVAAVWCWCRMSSWPAVFSSLRWGPPSPWRRWCRSLPPPPRSPWPWQPRWGWQSRMPANTWYCVASFSKINEYLLKFSVKYCIVFYFTARQIISHRINEFVINVIILMQKFRFRPHWRLVPYMSHERW